MSNQVGDCFKFLWPFQNVRTLIKTFAEPELTFSVMKNMAFKFKIFHVVSRIPKSMILRKFGYYEFVKFCGEQCCVMNIFASSTLIRLFF